ncbi:PREDICTED: uncharacterized protein LOC105969842 [Erythranthe guttata]|uniref:uncharacterized protein LOC105969842 n=1 Tax=Erythranthe guttata TaxID=4155 RepID=UPI00064D8BCE|nr:PREDICTED: uncharacterized protein LOC105969842 [Erythranthe guttata]|eukprot:XP_012850073.1 PREDICTED: uncharacterized protein LOC105969842 [Erythranthe guttata]
MVSQNTSTSSSSERTGSAVPSPVPRRGRRRPAPRKIVAPSSSRVGKKRVVEKPTHSLVDKFDLEALYVTQGMDPSFHLVVPSRNQTPSNPPPGYLTWYLDQFKAGLSFPLHPFFVDVSRVYRVPLHLFHPNAIKFMSCFYIVCVGTGVDPRPELFFSLFTHNRSSSGYFHLSTRIGRLFAGLVTKIDSWQRRFFFARPPSPWPFDPTPPTKSPKRAVLDVNFDEETARLLARVRPRAWNVEKVVSTTPLFSRAGLWRTPSLDRRPWGISPLFIFTRAVFSFLLLYYYYIFFCNLTSIFVSAADMMLDMLMEMAETEKKNTEDPFTQPQEAGASVVPGASSRGVEPPSHSSNSPSRAAPPSSNLQLAIPEVVIDLLDSEAEGRDPVASLGGNLGFEEAQGESAGASSKRPLPSDSTPPPKRARLVLPSLFSADDSEGSVDFALRQLARVQAAGDSSYLGNLPHSTRRAKLALCLAQASSIVASGFGEDDPSVHDQAVRELSLQAANARSALERASSRIYALMAENGSLSRQCELAEEKLQDVQSKLCETKSALEGQIARANEERDAAVRQLGVREQDFQEELLRCLTAERKKSLGELLATAEGLAVLDQYRVKLFQRYPHTKLFLKDACPIGMYYVKQTIAACEALASEQQAVVRYEPTVVLGKISRTLPLWKGDPREPIDYAWWQSITDDLISSVGSSSTSRLPEPLTTGPAGAASSAIAGPHSTLPLPPIPAANPVSASSAPLSIPSVAAEVVHRSSSS